MNCCAIRARWSLSCVPTALYEAGVISAVQQLTAQMKKHGLNVTVTTKGSKPALSADQAMVVYQSIRELLFNVLKHAKIDHASVFIHSEDTRHVEVTVADHGTGFDLLMITEQSSQGFGLFNIRERIEALGDNSRSGRPLDRARPRHF